jgi:small multidrug resistance pump
MFLMSYLFLALGILFEVLGTICMKFADGFSRLVPSIFVFIFYSLSLVALVFVLKKLPVSVAYAIWAGLGTALIAVIGIFWFKEPFTFIKLVSILFIVLGIIGLELW